MNPSPRPSVSIILPVLNERAWIELALAHLKGLGADELIVVDGGSRDGTVEAVRAHPEVTLLTTGPGRARQLNAGGRAARASVLLFAHADLRFPADAMVRILAVVAQGAIGGGFFKRYDDDSRWLRLYAWGLNHLFLARMQRLVGTNGIFVRRDCFMTLGGFPDLPICEDWEFSERLSRCGRLGIVRAPVTVSARRYRRAGVVRQIVANGRVLWGYAVRQESPERLRVRYDAAASGGGVAARRPAARGSHVALVGWLLVLPLVAGCATARRVDRPTLVRLFADLRQAPRKEPVIIVPGILGSVLEDTTTERIVWGQIWERDLEKLALPIDGPTLKNNRDSIVATNLIRKVTVIPNLVEFKVNEDLIGTLQDAGGYLKGDLEHALPSETCFLFWYDWRRDLVEAARQLGATIEGLKRALGDPNLKVHLVCQSAGGLIARYYVKYGMADVLDQDPIPEPTYAGAKNVSQVIMLGSPNGGSLEAFRSLQEGKTIQGIGTLSVPTIFTMPAIYQLLPHEEEPPFVDRHGQPLEVSLYDPANWEAYGWSVFSLEHQRTLRHEFHYQARLAQQRHYLSLVLTRAQRFHRALDTGNPAEDPVEYVLLGADCEPTLRRALLEKEGATWRTRFTTDDRALKPKLFGLGDGSVTKESLLGSHRLGISQSELAFSSLHVAYAVFVCEGHRQLTKNPTYLDNLLHALLSDEATAQHRAVCLYCQRRGGTVRQSQ